MAIKVICANTNYNDGTNCFFKLHLFYVRLPNLALILMLTILMKLFLKLISNVKAKLTPPRPSNFQETHSDQSPTDIYDTHYKMS